MDSIIVIAILTPKEGKLDDVPPPPRTGMELTARPRSPPA
jgi:hypothetical protein